MTKARKTPLRTCVTCGTTSEKHALVRIVRDTEGEVSVDPTGKRNGRGAYLCGRMDCFEQAVKRGRLDSALRVRLKDDDIDRLRREFEQSLATPIAAVQGR